jgi:hypothetical protein
VETTETHPIQAQAALEDELAALSAHINAATARWVELAWAFREAGGAAGDDLARWLAFRCGISGREAREAVRVAEALEELPAIRAAFARGELTFTKVRALTRVVTAASEEGLLELAGALTASQLERALRAFRRIAAEEAREAHELEYVDYHCRRRIPVLRARLPAEEGTLVVKALEAARERVAERRREERQSAGNASAKEFEPPRSTRVEALVELAEAALVGGGEVAAERARFVVHVDAAALTGEGSGRCELDGDLSSAPRPRSAWAATPRRRRRPSATASQ